MLQKIDISDEHLELVKCILKKYPYNFYVFGSRSKQQAKKFSDLDLCYFDNIDSAFGVDGKLCCPVTQTKLPLHDAYHE